MLLALARAKKSCNACAILLNPRGAARRGVKRGGRGQRLGIEKSIDQWPRAQDCRVRGGVLIYT